MREYKFRGKRKDNGEWAEGDLVRHYENQRRFIACDQLAYTYTECGIDRLVSECYYEVDPETVGQFTGLKDKNGKEICEGDILNEKGYNFTVVLDPKWAKFKLQHDGKVIQYPEWNRGVCMEVIGNIHDNPELLKGDRE